MSNNTLGLYSQASNTLSTNYHNSALSSSFSSDNKYLVQNGNSNLTTVLGNVLQDIYKNPSSSISLSKGLYDYELMFHITGLNNVNQSLALALSLDNSNNLIYGRYQVVSSTSATPSFSTSNNSIFLSENRIDNKTTITNSNTTTIYKIYVRGILAVSNNTVITPQFSSSSNITGTPLIQNGSYMYFNRLSADGSVYSN